MDSHLQETLTRAFRLAYFIHRDKHWALLIAAGALSKLEVAAAAQDKRLYYTPAGRTPGADTRLHTRTKVAMTELHLLQRLVYVESEAYEKKEESAGSEARLDEEDMIIRFIKHMVRITTRRNSFYVTLGLSRLLYQYGTNETAEIYDLVIQDSDRFKDAYYYRSRKRRLIQELCQRFESLVRLTRSKSGEERFESEDEPGRRVPLVSSCLDWFTPWNTSCPLPERKDLRADEILTLRFDGKDPDQEHPVEVRRMHALIHPGCYSRLVAALGLESTEIKLSVPRFFLAASNDESGRRPGDRTKAPALTDDEMMLVGAELAESARRRKASSARLLAIRVDGAEVATIDLNRESRRSFKVEESAELIEVLTRDSRGELLLASHLISSDEDDGAATASFSIQLEGGQKVAFTVSAPARGVALNDGLVVDVSYAESSVARAAAVYVRRLVSRFAVSPGGSGRRGFTMRPAFAAGLAVIFVAGILLYLRPWRTSGPGQIAKDTNQSEQPGNAGDQRPVIVEPSPNQPEPNDKDKAVANTGPGPSRNTDSVANSNQRAVKVPHSIPDTPSIAENQQPEQERQGVADTSSDTAYTDTRTMSPKLVAKHLAAIKLVYIDSLGSGEFADSVRTMLGEAMNKTGQLNTVSTKDKADAVFKGTAIAVRPGVQGGQRGDQSSGPRDQAALIGTVSIKLIAADGSTLWSWPHSGTAANIAETPSRLASVAVDELVATIRANRRK